MTFKSFTEISAWQKAGELSQRIYLLSGSGSFAMDVGLKDQINRATGSIMDNVDRGVRMSSLISLPIQKVLQVRRYLNYIVRSIAATFQKRNLNS